MKKWQQCHHCAWTLTSTRSFQYKLVSTKDPQIRVLVASFNPRLQKCKPMQIITSSPVHFGFASGTLGFYDRAVIRVQIILHSYGSVCQDLPWPCYLTCTSARSVRLSRVQPVEHFLKALTRASTDLQNRDRLRGWGNDVIHPEERFHFL